MKVKINNCGEILELEVQECCAENSPQNVLERPDLKPTVNERVRFCTKCGRHWHKCIKYVGAALEVSHDWVPAPFFWEESKKPIVVEENRNSFFF